MGPRFPCRGPDLFRTMPALRPILAESAFCPMMRARPNGLAAAKGMHLTEEQMKRFLLTAAMAALLAVPAHAALTVGAKAPDFKARASVGGKQFDFALAEALKKGPVVLYFYPAAFTPGCTLEANNFAEAMDDFAKLGATVIGVSHDTI